jgi:hypothetical protein
MTISGITVMRSLAEGEYRWIMYQWRAISFLIFGSMFWVVSMISTSLVWFLLGSHLEPDLGVTKKEDVFEVGEISSDSVKDESEDEVSNGSSAAAEFPALRRLVDIKEEPEIEESTMIEPLIRETGGGVGEADERQRGAGETTNPGFGTGLWNEERRIVQRRSGIGEGGADG